MRLQVLGCSGAEMPGHNPPALLLEETILLDAGTVTGVLDEKAQGKLRHIFITHAHLDHVRAIPSLADNLILRHGEEPVRVHGLERVLQILQRHLLNDNVWPDFTELPSTDTPVLAYDPMPPNVWKEVDGFRVMAVPVNHSVPACGFVLERGGTVLVYTGDTGPTEAIWKVNGQVNAAVVEVSFPNEMTAMALKTGHLSPELLGGELGKMSTRPERLLITHLKPQYEKEIQDQIGRLGFPSVHYLKEGDIIDL